jgi:hypothetical protein
MRRAGTTLALVLPLCLGLSLAEPARAAFPALYDFEGLAPGPLAGQDGWIASSGATVTTGTGFDSTLVLDDPSGSASAYRINDASFGFGSFDPLPDGAVIGFEFRADPAATDFANAELDFSQLPDQQNPFLGAVGLGYNGLFNQLFIRKADGSILAGGADNFADVPGDWYRVELRVHFPLGPGDAIGSVFVTNLTAGDPWPTSVPLLRLVALLLTTPGADPTAWDRVLVQTSHVQIDRIEVPEPGTRLAGLAALGSLAALRRRRAAARTAQRRIGPGSTKS